MQESLQPVEQTLVFLLQSGNHLNAVEELVSRFFIGENPKGRLCVQNHADNKKSFLHYALINYKEDVLEFLLNILPPEAYELVDADGITPLIMAIVLNRPVASVLVTKSNLKLQHVNGKSVLAFACETGNQAVIENIFKLAPLREQLNWQHFLDNDGNLPLYYATTQDHLDVVKLLVEEYRVPVHVKNNSGETLVHTCAKKNKTAICEFLLSKGANVNALDCLGSTPLITACDKQNDQVAKILLQHGANPFIKNSTNWTALALAQSKNDPILLDLLFEYGGAIGQSISISTATLPPIKDNKYFMIATDIPWKGLENSIRNLSDVLKNDFDDVTLQKFTKACLLCLTTDQNLSSRQKKSIQQFLDYQLRNKNLRGQLIYFLSTEQNCRLILKKPHAVEKFNALPHELRAFLPALTRLISKLHVQPTSSIGYSRIDEASPDSQVEEATTKHKAMELKVLPVTEVTDQLELIDRSNPARITGNENNKLSFPEPTNIDRRTQYLISINNLIEQLIQTRSQLSRYNKAKVVRGVVIGVWLLVILFLISLCSIPFEIGRLTFIVRSLTSDKLKFFLQTHVLNLLLPNDANQYSILTLWRKTILELLYDLNNGCKEWIYTETFYCWKPGEGHGDIYRIVLGDNNESCRYADYPRIEDEHLKDCTTPLNIFSSLFSFISKGSSFIYILSALAILILLLIAVYIGFALANKARPRMNILPQPKLDDEHTKFMYEFKDFVDSTVTEQNKTPEIASYIDRWRGLQKKLDDILMNKDIKQTDTALQESAKLIVTEKEIVQQYTKTGNKIEHYENPYTFFVASSSNEAKYDVERNELLSEQMQLN